MASIGRWRSPLRASGGFITVDPEFWMYGGILPDYPGVYPCPITLLISAASYQNSGKLGKLALNFAGRGKTDRYNVCGSADSYVTFTEDTIARINVWQAYRDGVWTSSTTIVIFISVPVSFGASEVINADVNSSGSLGLGVRHSKTPTGADITTACPTTVQATVTLNDDGSYSIA